MREAVRSSSISRCAVSFPRDSTIATLILAQNIRLFREGSENPVEIAENILMRFLGD